MTFVISCFKRYNFLGDVVKRYGIKGLLLFVSLLMMFNNGFSADAILASTVLVISSGLLSIVDRKNVRMGIVAIYALGAFFLEPLRYGFILISYDFDNPLLLLLWLPSVMKLPFVEQILTLVLCFIMWYIHELQIRLEIAIRAQDKYSLQQETLEINQQILTQQQIQKQSDDLEYTKISERNRIARDIHDNVGHLLSSAILQVGALQAINKDESKKEYYETLKTTLDQGMNAVRESVHDLYAHSSPLEHEILEIIQGMPSLDVELNYKITGDVESQIKNTILSIIKECLNNTHKHSDGNRVTITVDESERYYYCIVHDNGTVNKNKMMSGIGLASIEKRIQALRGLCNIQTENGYRIYINIPKEAL